MTSVGRNRNGCCGMSNRDKQTFVLGNCRRQIVTHVRAASRPGASKLFLIATATKVRVGDQVLALDNPFGVGESVSVGIVLEHRSRITSRHRCGDQQKPIGTRRP